MRKKTPQEVYDEMSRLLTEERNLDSMSVDEMSLGEILRLMNTEDRKVAEAVARELSYVEKAVDLIVRSLVDGGKLFYVGAGTSGRLGVLDAAECPPTFSTPPEMIQGIIAGGPEALVRSIEGAEDNMDACALELAKRGMCEKDVVVGIAASRRTPFVVGAIEYARGKGARTVYLCCNPRAQMDIEVDVSICPTPGPEVVTGSTRLKAGTAQKMVLNMLSTATMVKMGKVYENLMVDLQAKSQKLTERSKRIISTFTGLSYDEASRCLERAGGDLKTALVMSKTGLDKSSAQSRLHSAKGSVKRAIRGE
jgi:N-acetylmuramic acid 6-phosphate etherase